MGDRETRSGRESRADIVSLEHENCLAWLKPYSVQTSWKDEVDMKSHWLRCLSFLVQKAVIASGWLSNSFFQLSFKAHLRGWVVQPNWLLFILNFWNIAVLTRFFFPQVQGWVERRQVTFLSLNGVLHQRLAWVHSFIFQEPTLQYSILFPYSLIRHLQCQPLINWDPKFPTKQWLRELMILALVILNPVCAYSQHCHTVSIDWIESRLSINSQVPQGARVASNLFQS